MQRVGIGWMLCLLAIGCGDGGDQIPDAIAGPRAGDLRWYVTAGNIGGDQGGAVAALEDDFVVGGSFARDLELGGQSATAVGAGDALLARMSGQDRAVWLQRFGGPGGSARITSVAAAGATLGASGWFYGNLEIDGVAHVGDGAGDAFVVALSPDGVVRWSRAVVGGDADSLAVAVAGDGDIVVAGAVSTGADLGQGPITAAGPTDVAIARLDGDGAARWVVTAGDTETQSARDAAVDGNGDVLVTGTFEGSIDFGCGTLTAPPYWFSAFVVKLTGDTGSCLWSHGLGTQYGVEGLALAVSPTGSVAVSGRFYGDLSIGDADLPSGQGDASYLIAFTGAGDPIWARRFGGGAYEPVWDLTWPEADRLYLTGTFSDQIQVGGGQISAGDSEGDVFIIAYDAAGYSVWGQSFIGIGAMFGNGIVTHDTHGIVVTGGFEGGVRLDADQAESAGSSDLFILAVEP